MGSTIALLPTRCSAPGATLSHQELDLRSRSPHGGLSVTFSVGKAAGEYGKPLSLSFFCRNVTMSEQDVNQ